MSLRRCALVLALLASAPAFAGDCAYQLIPEWEVLRGLRTELTTSPYNAAFTAEVQQIDGLFRELDTWIGQATQISRDLCEPLYQRGRALEARIAAFQARCQGTIELQAELDACHAEQAAGNQEISAVRAMQQNFEAALGPLNSRGMDLVARTQAATRTISALARDPGAMLTRYARHVQQQGGTADSCRSLSEVITAAARNHNGNSTATIDALAVALTSGGGSGFTSSGFKSEYRISGDPAFRTVTWLALGYRGGADGDDPLNRAAATLGKQLRQGSNAAGLGASIRAQLCGS